MSETVKAINKFFKEALKTDVDNIKINLLLSDRQDKVFEMFYIKKHDINYIADTLNVCPMVINKELKIIRKKLIKLM